MKTILLREQASSTGLTVPEAKAKAAVKRGPRIHGLIANDLFVEEPPEEMLASSSETESSRQGSLASVATRQMIN